MIDPRAKGNLKIYDEKIIKEIKLLHWKVFTKSKESSRKGIKEHNYKKDMRNRKRKSEIADINPTTIDAHYCYRKSLRTLD